MRNLIIICAFAFGFMACDNPAGEGGTSIIEGQVYKIFTFQNPTTGAWDTTYFQLDAGRDIFIIYSDDKAELYDDNFDTDYNGKYHFEYLRKGEYTIYTYADSTDNSNVKHEYPVFKQITISSNNSTNTVGDFIIEKNQ
jgi:hypothetical protein